MNFIRLKIYTSEFGIEKVSAMLKYKGYEAATEEEMASVETMAGKFMQTTIRDEITIVVFDKDDEEGQKRVKDLKVTCMMVKSKELEGIWGWDVTLGRMYAEDEIVTAENWEQY